MTTLQLLASPGPLSIVDGPACSDGFATGGGTPEPRREIVVRTGRMVALERLYAELSHPDAGGRSAAQVRNLEARVAAAVLGPAAFERGRWPDLFRVDPDEAEISELIRPGEGERGRTAECEPGRARGLVGARPICRSLDAVLNLARDAHFDAGWALRLAVGPERVGSQPTVDAGDAGGTPDIARAVCRILVLACLVAEVAVPSVPAEDLDRFAAELTRVERQVLGALAASERSLEASSLTMAPERRVRAMLWRLGRLGLVGRAGGLWTATRLGRGVDRRLRVDVIAPRILGSIGNGNPDPVQSGSPSRRSHRGRRASAAVGGGVGATAASAGLCAGTLFLQEDQASREEPVAVSTVVNALTGRTWRTG